MTAKEYLSQAGELNTRLIAMKGQLEFLKSAAECVTSSIGDGMPRASSRNIHSREDAMVRMLDFERKMNKVYIKIADINDTISEVSSPIHQAILVSRYIDGKQWREIAADYKKGERQILNFHRKALEEVDKLLLEKNHDCSKLQ